MQPESKKGGVVGNTQLPAPKPILEKRKSVDDLGSPPNGINVWPQKRKVSSSASSPVKAFLQDVDMENSSLGKCC